MFSLRRIPLLGGRGNWRYLGRDLSQENNCTIQRLSNTIRTNSTITSSSERDLLINKDHNKITLDHNLRIALEHLINRYSSKPVPTVTLSDLLKFNLHSEHHDKEKMLLDNANETMSDMLVLVLKRLHEFMKLPYICVVNPNITEIFNTYLKTLEMLTDFAVTVNPEFTTDNIEDFHIVNMDQNDEFIKVLQKTLDLHTDNLTILSEGFEEVSSLGIVDDKMFLNDHLKERILMRLLTNHHIALSQQMLRINHLDIRYKDLNQIGIIEKNVDVLDVLNRSKTFVNDMCSLKYDEKISINVEVVTLHDADKTKSIRKFKDGEDFGDCKVLFPCISSHLEYVLNEVFKNSARAHIENKVHDPVEVVLVINEPSENLPGPQIYNLEIKVSDKGKGISPEIINNLFDYSFTTFEAENEEGDSYKTLNNTGGNSANIIAGMGYGLPLSKIYVELFDGYIDIHSIHTYGTDVLLKWKGPDLKLLV